MSQTCDLSIELPHLYLRDVTRERAEGALQFAHAFVQPILQSLEHAGRSFSRVLLIDDYFYREDDPISPAEAIEIYQDAAKRQDVTIDHIILESSLAETVEKLLALVQEEPREGAGSRGGQKLEPIAKTGWLSNGDAMRQTYSPIEKTMGKKWVGSAKRVSKPMYEHSIYLDTQLFQDCDGARRYACPTLAAWWQLVRLGVDREEDSRLRTPSGAISRTDASPLFARRTLSILDPSHIPVEHAVRDILRQTFIPPELTTVARGRSRNFDLRDAISYIFINENNFPVSLS